MSSFPADFFEYCVAMNDVEFGGNDLLQIYNPQQIKHRLNSSGKDSVIITLVFSCNCFFFLNLNNYHF